MIPARIFWFQIWTNFNNLTECGPNVDLKSDQLDPVGYLGHESTSNFRQNTAMHNEHATCSPVIGCVYCATLNWPYGQ